MSDHYRVRIEKDTLVFSAGHFITFAGNICERLHGHNYRVAAEVSGPLDENHYVVDFIALRDTLASIVKEIDHYMLLPTQHEQIKVRADDREVEATFEDRRWVFPKADCVLLDVPNTTAEMLAKHIARRLLEGLKSRGIAVPEQLTIEVDECYGQLGVYTWRRD